MVINVFHFLFKRLNDAAEMYRKIGFDIIRETEEEWIMVWKSVNFKVKDHNYDTAERYQNNLHLGL